MITQDNIKHTLREFSPNQIDEALQDERDYLKIWLHIFNVGVSATLEPMDYSIEEDDHARDNGQLFIDKDQFIQLLEENDIHY